MCTKGCYARVRNTNVGTLDSVTSLDPFFPISDRAALGDGEDASAGRSARLPCASASAQGHFTAKSNFPMLTPLPTHFHDESGGQQSVTDRQSTSHNQFNMEVPDNSMIIDQQKHFSSGYRHRDCVCDNNHCGCSGERWSCVLIQVFCVDVNSQSTWF